MAVSPETFLAMGREVLAQQSFSRLLGTELAALAPGQVELQLPLRDDLLQFAALARWKARDAWRRSSQGPP